MTAHNIQDCHNNNIATRSKMVFDDFFLASSRTKATMDATTPKQCTRRLVSPSYDQDHAKADFSTIPIATPVSLCTSEDSDVSDTSAAPITGRIRDIEDKYYVDPTVLGTGHNGSVRACINRVTGQRYAVKSICKNGKATKAGSLVREIMLLKEMKHHSIIQLVDIYEDTDHIHLITDLCSGGELFDRIIERSSSDNGVPCFTEKEAARVLHQILVAVSYMHEKGIAHRDIKPENILFESKDADSPIKVIDFGLARKHMYGEPPMSTLLGTPYYIAPEVLRKRYTKSCDLWSVGVIAYILLCGYPPFNGGDNNETHRSVLQGRYCFPSKDWNGTSQESRDFIRQLLRMDPNKRMTVDQALNHPWIRMHVGSDASIVEDRQDTLMPNSDEVEVKGLAPSRRGSMICSRIARRKYRTSMFGI